MVHFKHRLPTKEDIMSLQQYCLTQGDAPWNPSAFTDKVADVFYKQVIDMESYNANSVKLFPNDPYDTYENRGVVGKPANLTFCPKMTMKFQDAQTLSTNTVPHFSKALPSNIDYERLSP
jgi:hypothetical protein